MIFETTFSSRRVRSFGAIAGSSWTSTAAFTWQGVHQGFFFPKARGLLAEEVEAQVREYQVTHQRLVVADLEVIESDFSFTVFEEPLDVPTGEGDVQQRLERNVGPSVGEKVLHLAAQDVLGDDQSTLSAWKVIVPGVEACLAHAPDFGPFLRVLDSERLPRWSTSLPKSGDGTRGFLSRCQVWHARSVSRGPERSRWVYPRLVRPTAEIRRDLHHAVEPPVRHGVAECRATTVELVSGDPSKRDAIVERSSQQVECDPPLWPVDDVLGDTRFTTAPAILSPTFLGQVEVAVDEGMEIGSHVSEVDGDDAVLDLARVAAVLRSTWSQELMTLVLYEKTRVQVSRKTIGRMLSMLNARWGQPRPTVISPMPKAQKTRRIRRIQKLIDELPTDEVVVYEDEVDIHLNPKIGRDWMLVGEQKVVVTPGVNKKRYIAGALNAKTGDIVYVTAEKKDSDLFIRLLAKLKKVYPEAKRIHLILDNYSIHSSNKVEVSLQHFAKNFVLHFLPPYSPKYNDIEMLWKQVHDNITRNHKCSTIQQLMKKVEKFLARASPFPGSKPSVAKIYSANTKKRKAS